MKKLGGEKKKMNKTKIWVPGITIVMVLMLSVVGMAHTADTPFSTNLTAGQYINAGNVSVWNDEVNLYVKYETTGNWSLNETHLAVVNTSYMDIPQTKKGNPIPGKFDYKNESLTTQTDTYVIPLEWGVDEELFIAAHAEVQLLNETGAIVQEETAWGEGYDFPGKNWAMYFNYSIQLQEPEEP